MRGSAIFTALSISAMNLGFHLGTWIFHALGLNPEFEPIDGSTIWLHIALTLDYAIEFPSILVYHPSTLLHPRDALGWATIPGPSQLILQLAIFFLVEASLQKVVFAQMVIFPGSGTGADTSTQQAACDEHSLVTSADDKAKLTWDDEDRLATRIVFDFIRPRATLLIVAWLLGGPGELTAVTGLAHAAPMAFWVVLQQAVAWDEPSRLGTSR
ncbi:hypothetical protein NX059_000824 [Plenodomus lindquistii]|nr:hypothetical protein NX059_000824 [Plenodomus lindquistii]